MNTRSRIDFLVGQFLEKARFLQANVEPIKVLKARVYQIGKANVLVRAASEGKRNYFFGINYITIEEIANLDNPFIAFICGSIERIVIIPAQLLFNHLHEISHDRNGEYKINIDKDLNIALKGRGKRLNCKEFINNFELLLKPPKLIGITNTAEESLHSVLQGRLLEIGNSRNLKTFCPDKSKRFNDKKLSDISTLEKCPDLQFSNYDVLRQIDVLWFREKGRNYIPEYAFEIELTTGTWSGVGRLATLIDYSNVKLYVISNNSRRYQQVMHSFAEYENRFHHTDLELIGDLYAAEIHLRKLRYKIGL